MRTGRNASANAKHDAEGRELGLGRVMYVNIPVLYEYISPKGVCDGGVKYRRWGWDYGQKKTPSGQK